MHHEVLTIVAAGAVILTVITAMALVLRHHHVPPAEVVHLRDPRSLVRMLSSEEAVAEAAHRAAAFEHDAAARASRRAAHYESLAASAPLDGQASLHALTERSAS